jgi:hypothetical protein
VELINPIEVFAFRFLERAKRNPTFRDWISDFVLSSITELLF